MGRLHASTALLAVLTLTGVAGAAQAGATSSGGCGCVPTTHQVKVPGIEVSAPSAMVNFPVLNVVTGNGSSGNSSSSSSGSSNTNSSSNTSSNTSNSASTSITSSSSGVSSAQAIANANTAAIGGGGSGSWSDSGSVTTTIDSIQVEQPMQTRRICAEFKAEARAIAVQASCLDDKSIPHPASQLGPERQIGDTFEGEIYRCIAGARMQYTIADYNGQANFDHGQTLTCQKGEALYHTAAGALQCRAQKPARDCNERSLLRRFGAGIKILKGSESKICVAWRTESYQANAGTD